MENLESDAVASRPQTMPPGLATWTADNLEKRRFEMLRQKPLTAVALAAERYTSNQGNDDMPDEIIDQWIQLVATQQRELDSSREALLRLAEANDRLAHAEASLKRLGKPHE